MSEAQRNEGPLDRRVGRLALDGKYGDVLEPFVALMEAELHANAGKGDRPGWLSMTPAVGMLEIYYHTAKLQKAVKDGDIARIREHAADVANMSMMMLDICGGLLPPNVLADRPAAPFAAGPATEGSEVERRVSGLDSNGEQHGTS